MVVQQLRIDRALRPPHRSGDVPRSAPTAGGAWRPSTTARGALRRRLLAVLGAAALVALPSVASACARDGIPSVSADGHLAVLNRSTTRVVLTTWSPFVFRQPAQRGHSVALAEDNREVARTLPRGVFGHPWRWDFGDHSSPAYGTRVHHTYRTAGTYRIGVYAYYRIYGAWQPFDYVTIHVR